jgi:hypothetical protein
LWAQLGLVTKLLIILLFGGALANSLASAHREPPLLIDSQPSSASLDATN